MAHHGKNPINEEIAQELFARQMAEAAKQLQIYANDLGLGPTGEFPEGKLVEHDEGEIKLAITHYQGKVVLNFGSPVAFVGFTPEQAVEIAKVVLQHARAAIGA